MSTRPFLMGSEIEFGIAGLDPREQNHITNSLRLVGFCPERPAPECLWDYDGENPLLDLFGKLCDGEREDPDPYANRALNKVLANGGRFYVDGAHPEYCTPEVTDPLALVRYESAGERIANRAREIADRAVGQPSLAVFKNNSDGKGNSYGYHENYLVYRQVAPEALAAALIPYLVTRQIYSGAGKVGAENRRDPVPFQLSQRADFFETLIGLNTMTRRPLFNTRDEPHANREQWLRLHVIPGDANLCQVATFLKVGTMALVLRLIEDDALGPVPELADPLEAFRQVSRDLGLRQSLPLADGRSMTAIQIQRCYLERVQDYARTHELPGSFPLVIERWQTVLDALEGDPLSVGPQVDWVLKYRMIDSYLKKKGLDWNSPRAKAMDIQYHDINPDKGLFHTLKRRERVEILVDDDAVEAAQRTPPEDTRAWFRGACLARFGKAVYGVSWDSVMLDTGDEIRRIPTLDPFKGAKAQLQAVLAECATPQDLIERLQGG